jgi:hypothetical protein
MSNAIGPVQPIPYEVYSNYTKINRTTNRLERHTYISINGGQPVHKVESSVYNVYTKTGKIEASNAMGQKVDKHV